jgi:hypothetical protein
MDRLCQLNQAEEILKQQLFGIINAAHEVVTLSLSKGDW